MNNTNGPDPKAAPWRVVTGRIPSFLEDVETLALWVAQKREMTERVMASAADRCCTVQGAVRAKPESSLCAKNLPAQDES